MATECQLEKLINPQSVQILNGVRDLEKIVYDYVGPIEEETIAKIYALFPDEEIAQKITKNWLVDLESAISAAKGSVYEYNNPEYRLTYILVLIAALRCFHFGDKVLFLCSTPYYGVQAKQFFNIFQMGWNKSSHKNEMEHQDKGSVSF